MDVLLVEDEAMVRRVLAEELADAGLVVAEAPGAEAALAVLDAAREAGRPPPSVLVTDVDLGPGMDGLALAAEARRRWPGVGVVLMTGRPANLDGRRPRRGEAHLFKPFPLSRLSAAVLALAPRPATGVAAASGAAAASAAAGGAGGGPMPR